MNELTDSQIKDLLRTEADSVEVPTGLADRTINAARSGQPSMTTGLSDRLRSMLTWQRWMLAPVAVATVLALFFVGTVGPSMFRASDQPMFDLTSGPGPRVGSEKLLSAPSAPEPAMAPDSGNSATLSQTGRAKSGDSVAGGAVTGAVGRDVTIQNQNDASAPDIAPAPSNPGLPPKLIRTAYLDVQIPSGRFDEVWAKANAVAGRHGGFVINASTNLSDSTPDPKPIPLGAPAEDVPGKNRFALGTLTARVPSDQLDSALTDFRDLGKVTRISTDGSDVSATLADLDARIRAAEAQEAQLAELMKQAKTVDETLQVRSRLDSVRGEIEQLKAQKQSTQGQVDFSTITLSISEKTKGDKVDSVDGTGFTDAIKVATTIATTIAKGLIIAAGLLLPLTVIALILWGLVTVVRRRRAGGTQ